MSENWDEDEGAPPQRPAPLEDPVTKMAVLSLPGGYMVIPDGLQALGHKLGADAMFIGDDSTIEYAKIGEGSWRVFPEEERAKDSTVAPFRPLK